MSKIKRKNKSYSYAQIVQSFRRKEDGLPAHRVLANLGQLSDLEIENMRAAFNASKSNKKVVVKVSHSISKKLSKPKQNLVYLDLVVLHEIWNQSGIASILQESFGESSSQIPMDIIVSILCLHRCQDPGSKLSATRWYKSTALPEITAIAPSSFNNTRLHRTLYELEQATSTIMAKLPKLYKNLDSNFSALFLDISDAWFHGNGPELAKKGLSKDGAIRTKIGIVLLCNKDGLPIRWEVVSGAANDSGLMLDMLEEIKHLSWMQGVPLVCDRAMGRTSLITKMHEKNILFLTALSRHEYINYTGSLEKSRIEFPIINLSEDAIATKARALIEKNKDFTKVTDDLFTTDLGILEVSVLGKNSDYRAHMKYSGNRIQSAMDLGRQIKKMVTDGKFGSVMAAGAFIGLKPGLSAKYHNLNKLPEQVQLAILNGEADNCSIDKIEKIAINEKAEDMFNKFFDHVEDVKKNPKKIRRLYSQVTSALESDNKIEGASNIKVRVIAYFNPQMYADQKFRSRKWLKKISEFEEDLNRRLSSPSSRRKKDSVYAEIDRFIRKKDLLRCFDIKINEAATGSKRKSLSVKLELNQKEWKKKHAFDGFCILVAHSDCRLSATQLCQLYREKDIVEKDFQIIKSVLQIRPIRRRSDLKVKAHLTICMLALLLDRILQKKLKGSFSVGEALDILHTCHLNRFEVDNESLYTITELDTQQEKILKKLGMLHLADDDYLLERIQKR